MTSPSILLVEDSEDDAELTIRAFRNGTAQPEIHLARDGPTAVEALLGSTRVPPPRRLPSLVLLDLKLPGLDGFAVLNRIRTHPRTQYLPVVILTSSTERSDLERGYQLGANSYVRKPVSFRDFQGVAACITAYWLTVNEVPPAGLPVPAPEDFT
jgi:two-component system response regulator